MPPRPFQFQHGALHFPELGLWMDPHEPVTGPERAFVSHAHSDHTAPHREVILSEPTARLMQSRLGGERIEHRLPFGERTPLAWGGRPFHLTLLPAGHILGSAMGLLEWEGRSLLYTGDFKMRRGQSAEACDASAARGVDVLIMETTFGRPHYRFPRTEEVMTGIVRFCRESLDNDEVPVLLGYSLGKSQELLCGLAEAGLPIMLHGSVERLTRVYEGMGQRFPPYQPYEPRELAGKVLICPPNGVSPGLRRSVARMRTAVLTGWAVDPGCRFRYQADAAFPLSDHADFPDLVRFVQEVGPKQVYTLHGFAAEFAETLRGLGFPAQALTEDEQLSLPLASTSVGMEPSLSSNAPAGPNRGTGVVSDLDRDETSSAVNEPESLAAFAATCEAVAGTSSKLSKSALVADYLRTLGQETVPTVVTWLTGRPFPAPENKVLQLGWAILRDALCQVGNLTLEEFRHVYLKHSDTGETAFEVLRGRPAGQPLTVRDVADGFQRLHEARGPGLKLELLAGLLRRCPAREARFLVKIITGDLRIGLKEGLLEDALAAAFRVPVEQVRQANLLTGHLGETALLARAGELDRAGVTPFRPVKFMLASPEPTAEAIWSRLRPPAEGGPPASVWLEDKYDGIRCQAHKIGRRVGLYSRDLKEITGMFPEVVDALAGLAEDFILDGEILAMRDEQVLPFSELQKRLGRREGDLFLGEEIPVQLVAFDLLWRDGQTLMKDPLCQRREQLERLTFPRGVRLARVTPAASPEAIEEAFGAARTREHEGLMAKDPSSVYAPGRRGLAWLKLKKALASLDCVVIGAEYGHGKRSQVLSDYTFAVRDESGGGLKTIGKAYTGLTDVEIRELTRHFLSRVVRQRGRYHEVSPDVVLEVAFDRIQPSARHNSGLALRFPRILRIRSDKTIDQIDTLAAARRLAGVG